MGGQPTRDRLGYTREQAVIYDAVRKRQLTWYRENDIIEKWSRTLAPGTRVLDIPCGTGRLLPIFLARGARVVGVDLSQDMLAQVPDVYRNSDLLEGLEVGDASKLEYADGSFDYVVSLRLFHLLRIPKEIQAQMLDEFTRVARRGVVLHVPLLGRSAASRLADFGWRLFSFRREGPIGLAMNRSRARERASDRKRRRADGGRRGVTKSEGRRSGVWTLPEIERAFKERGFELSEVHGAISPFSSKKILVATRVA